MITSCKEMGGTQLFGTGAVLLADLGNILEALAKSMAEHGLSKDDTRKTLVAITDHAVTTAYTQAPAPDREAKLTKNIKEDVEE